MQKGVAKSKQQNLRTISGNLYISVGEDK